MVNDDYVVNNTEFTALPNFSSLNMHDMFVMTESFCILNFVISVLRM